MNTDTETPFCRICYDTQKYHSKYGCFSKSENLIQSPCYACTGSSGYLHKSCLERWLILQHQIQQDSPFKCDICKQDFNVQFIVQEKKQNIKRNACLFYLFVESLVWGCYLIWCKNNRLLWTIFCAVITVYFAITHSKAYNSDMEAQRNRPPIRTLHILPKRELIEV